MILNSKGAYICSKVDLLFQVSSFGFGAAGNGGSIFRREHQARSQGQVLQQHRRRRVRRRAVRALHKVPKGFDASAAERLLLERSPQAGN